MPSDANGVYSLPSGYLAVTGETIQASQHNPPLEDLASAMSARLMRSGAAPMTGPLKAVDGSVGSPAVQFSNGTSTGLYKTANGIGVSVGGTQVAEFAAGGLTAGALPVGTLLPYSATTAPANWVLPYGQTLSRATYPALWALAQIEIAAGNTFYNNGNGSTTFGIGDMRGRVPAGADAMGGSAASRLTASGFGAAAALGATGGAETVTLVTANLPPYTPTGSVSTSGTTNLEIRAINGSTTTQNVYGPGGTSGTVNVPFVATSVFTGTAQGGTSTPVKNVQPTQIVNFLLFAGA